MFGYVTINRQELKVKDLDHYQAYYCGLCRQIRRRYGLLESGALNYDMTFLTILLASLYEEPEEMAGNRCLLHPFERRRLILSRAGEYAADINFMLAYHNMMDNWLDERRIGSRVMVSLMHRKYRETAARYPRQHKALVRYVRKLHVCERSGNPDIEAAATLTGHAVAEIYVREEDMWAQPLRQMGFYMGKFIYLMDAYEDVEKDIKSHNYNPFIPLYQSGRLEEKAEEYLKLMMGECCRAFETLPVIENADLLRNILYSGVWVKFAYITKMRQKRAEGKKKDGSI